MVWAAEFSFGCSQMEKEKLVRVHVVERSKGIVRPAAGVRFFESADQLNRFIGDVGPNEERCCFLASRIESVEVFFGSYNPNYPKGKRDYDD